MQTLKTTFIVILLVVVFYGVYEVLNSPPDEPPTEVAMLDEQGIAPPDIDFGTTMEPGFAEPMVSIPSDDATPSDPASSFQPPPANPRPGDVPSAEDYASLEPPTPVNDGLSGSPQIDLPAGVPAAAAPLADEMVAQQAPSASPAIGLPVDPSDSSDSGTGQVQHNQFYNDPITNSTGIADDIAPAIGTQAFNKAMRLARAQIDQGKYHDALFELSIFYGSPDLTPEQHTELLNLLDPLAAKVVYSREHLILPAYKVGRNDTLMDIAAKYNVPWQLLQKINGIEKPRVLLPNSEIKVVPGPFQAEVDLKSGQLTLFLGQLYAGRFPVSVGTDSQVGGGDFKIRDKRESRDYFAANGQMIPSSNPNNPYGRAWLDLGNELSIHGSPMTGAANATSGCISLSPRDANDVYSILSVGSRVRIVR